MVYRIFVEKKAGLENEAKGLLNEAKNLLGIEKLENKPTFTPKEIVLEKKTASTPQFGDVADAVSQFRAALGV